VRHRTSDKPSGIGLLNCYALDEQHRPVERFQCEAGLDAMHPIISGAGLVGAVDTVVTFIGRAFLISVNTEPLLFLTAHHMLGEPLVDDEFNEDTPERSAFQWPQGACMQHGHGRVVVFGEAAMFSGQL
jgi:hypothetical protein